MPACRECAGRDLAFSSASAAYCYEGPARALVTACKFRALRSLADDLAVRAAPAFLAVVAAAGESAVVTSVPAHRDHRLERGFDLAESFARRLARDAGSPMLRCSAACATEPVRAGSTGLRARATSTTRSRCAMTASG